MRALAALLSFLALATDLPALELSVAPGGDDAGPGTRARPLATLAEARDRLRASGRLGKEPVVVRLADGIHFLRETLVLDGRDGGSAEHPVVWRAANEGKATVSGGIDLGSGWRDDGGGRWSVAAPAGAVIDGLEVDGEPQVLARFPDRDAAAKDTPYRGAATAAEIHARAKGWKDPAGGHLHALHAALWGGYHFRILGRNPDGGLRTEGGWQNNRPGPAHPRFQMAEGVREELDAPGEWFHDRAAGRVIWIPPGGTARGRAVGASLENLVVIRGEPGRPVAHLRLEGLAFRHTARTFMRTREPLLRSDWTFHRGGALLIEDATDIVVSDGALSGLGGNGIVVSGHARRIALRGLLLQDIGASGVAFVGRPESVRNPLFHYDRRLKVGELDRTPGPRGDAFPSDCVLEDSLIRRVGLVERQAAGVQLAMARRITLRHLTVHETSRAGINIGDGTWGGHLIEGCDVFDTVLETADHGSFNSWGRDRYWGAASDDDVAREPGLPFLDAQEPVVIRHSRWRCEHGWDVDLDDGSSNYEIHHNLFLRGGLKLREGWRRKAWNNVFVNCGLHPHVWHRGSGDLLRRNILLDRHAPIGMPADWGREIDGNLFARAEDLAHARGLGVDGASVAGDPLFVDPASGDFRVRPGSPALALGFENFPMDRFGVLKPALRALAPTPLIDPPRLRSETAPDTPPPHWRGIPLAPLDGEAFSAYGVARNSPGVILGPIPAGHPLLTLAPAGHLLVTLVGKETVGTPAEFLAATRRGTPGLTVVRSDIQQPTRVAADHPALRDTPVAGEAASQPDTLRSVPGRQSRHAVTWESRPAPANDPVRELGDGRLDRDYGPVFANGTKGLYRADLGQAKEVGAVRAWSFRQSDTRLPQRLTVLGSDAADPGWDAGKYRWLGEIRAEAGAGDWLATEIRVRARVRWILLVPESPVTDEATVFQEIEVGP